MTYSVQCPICGGNLEYIGEMHLLCADCGKELEIVFPVHRTVKIDFNIRRKEDKHETD